MTTTYDAIMIGSGQGGGPLAGALAQAGWKTAIIEREHIGGTCVNEGCTPTKTMVASARVAYLARRAADYGVQSGPISVDMSVVRKRKRDIVDSFRSGSENSTRNTEGLDLFMGTAHFTGVKTIEVQLNTGETRLLNANTIFINAGERPAKPSLPGIENVPYLNSTSIMELDTVPEHLLVLGGGYVGLEFGQMFRRFGSKVTIVQRGTHLLAREDNDVAEAIADIMREDGIEVLLRTSAARVEKAKDGTILLTVNTPDGERTLSGTHLLSAAGRVPNTDSLNLSACGVQTNKRGYIETNEKLETNVPGIYALGDIKGPPAFTHISYDDFRILRTNLIQHGNVSIHDRLVPYTVFIDPQLGRVGLSEAEAKEQGRKIGSRKCP